LFICALSFLGGILLILQLAELPSLWWGLLVLPVVFLSLKWPRLLPIAFFATGVFWASFYAGLRLNEQLSAELQGKDLVIEGVVSSIPKITSNGYRFTFDTERKEGSAGGQQVPKRLLLSLYRSRLRPAIGERWRFTVRLKRPHGFQNPGGFDYEAWLFQQGVRARGYVRHGEMLGYAPFSSTARFRQRVADQFQAWLPGNRFTGIVTALAVGSRNGIDTKQWQVFRATGTSHLMAISGLHVGLIAGIGFFLTRWAWSLPGSTVLRLPAPAAGAIGAIVLGFLYAALAGFSIPTQRALVMLVVAMGGLIWLRKLSPNVVIGSSLLAVLVFDPMAPLSAGFWLSFLAVMAIVYFGRWRRSRELPIFRLARIQWVLALVLTPLTLLLFQSASLAAPVANLVAVPLFALVIVPLTLLAVVAGQILPAVVPTYILSVAVTMLEGLWMALSWLADVMPMIYQSVSIYSVMPALAGAFLLSLPPAVPSRWIGVIGFIPLCFPGISTTLRDGDVRLTLLDVGQGLSVVVQTRSRTVVYDTGPRFSTGFDTGKGVVVPYLRHLGRPTVDMLVVSHGDTDHIGGAESLGNSLKLRQIISSVPDKIELTGVPLLKCRAGQQWQWDGVKFVVLSPSAWQGSSNNNSCVLRVSGRHGSILLPGDIERDQERRLVSRYGAGLSASVLVAPHHGSRTSSSSSFIDAVSPEVVLFPAGYRNRYRHPNRQVVNRYRARGIEIANTASAGAITVSFSGAGPVTHRFRQQSRRFWFNQPAESGPVLRPTEGLLN
jgi:competence protein ComEC